MRRLIWRIKHPGSVDWAMLVRRLHVYFNKESEDGG